LYADSESYGFCDAFAELSRKINNDGFIHLGEVMNEDKRKLISFTVPCYNSAAYMRKAIDSLLEGGDEVEIFIIDDGSTKDDTLAIAQEYESMHPGICHAIHQENGGHGAGVNNGLAHATGHYFKVVDSDDWVDRDSYMKILDAIRGLVRSGQDIDLLLCNFVYEHVSDNTQYTVDLHSVFPEGCCFTWADTRPFKPSQFLAMHSMFYRTDFVKAIGLELPRHCFFVDNVFIFYPLPHVKSMFYLSVNFYRYFIGREDQSVNEATYLKRIDQQIKVTKTLLGYYNPENYKKSKRLYAYMRKHLMFMIMIPSVFLRMNPSPENEEKHKEIWRFVKDTRPESYRYFRYHYLGIASNLEGSWGSRLTAQLYHATQRRMRFN
jgi:glycosyltransferase involved in cell wall biosynthesis